MKVDYVKLSQLIQAIKAVNPTRTVGACAVVLCLTFINAKHTRAAHHCIQTFAGQLAYDQEVANLGGRISSAFGIRQTVAEEFSYWLVEASERQGISPDVLASLF